MQIGVFAEIGRGELVQFALAVEQRLAVGVAVEVEAVVGRFFEQDVPVGREEPWVPEGALARWRDAFSERVMRSRSG